MWPGPSASLRCPGLALPGLRGLSPGHTLAWRWVGLLLLAGMLIVCHGCHGDEDNELFAPARVAALRR